MIERTTPLLLTLRRKEMKTYVTFAKDEAHEINGKLFDYYCVAVINSPDALEGRRLAFKFFGSDFCKEIPECNWKPSSLQYFPRGLIEVN